MKKDNEVVKETILFILESTLFTFSIFGSWVMEYCLGLDYFIEIAVRSCIIAFYIIRLWNSEELKEKPINFSIFVIALIPAFLIFALNGFRFNNDFSLSVIPLCLITATCEELHFRVNGCHLFREDGILGYADCAVLIIVFSVCRIFTFVAEGVSPSIMSVLESLATGVLLLGYYLKCGNTKSLIAIHTLLLISEHLVFKSSIPLIELFSIIPSIVIGLVLIKTSSS